MRRLLARLWRVTPFGRRRANGPAPLLHRPATFCDRHWSWIVESRAAGRPINPYWVMIGIAVYLRAHNYPPQPTPHACCKLPEKALRGVMRLSRNRP